MNRIELKSDAKESLRGHWAETIKVLLILAIISIGCTILFQYILHFGIYEYEMILEDQKVTYTVNFISPIIDCLLTFGFLSYFLKISRNEEVTCSELFSKINMVLKFIILSILSTIVITLGFICLVIPGFILAISLSQTSYILLDNKDMSVIEAMKLSFKMMKGYKMEYFILILSFLGWAIILVFTLFIGYFWLIPYMQTTLCNFYNNLKEEYQEKAE